MTVVESVEHVGALMEKAKFRRTTSSTSLNEQSSRSHAIYTLSVTSAPLKSSLRESKSEHPSPDVIHAKLTLVDLAGSGRIKDTGVVGSKRRESININNDLFALGKVVS
jgi:hypothetical protein